MKKITLTISIITAIIIATTYLIKPLDFNKHVYEHDKLEVEDGTSLFHLSTQSHTPKVVTEKPKVPLKNQSFSQFLASMPEHDQEKYIKLNDYFFGVLAFNSPQEYAILKEQGFPSLKEINYVMEYTRHELNTILWGNLNSGPRNKEDVPLSRSAITSVNLMATIEEVTQVIRYYFPEYEQNTPIPTLHKWPNGKHPEQVVEALRLLIGSQVGIPDSTAIGLLASARFDQLISDSPTQKKVMLTKLAMANKKLQGNDNILNYVKKHYPEELDTYIDLTNTL
jgi:hypothetical protein